jgi:hypothetical protein
VLAVLIWLVRRLERWLHEHIFKVGWLFTKRLSTTTVTYYLLFLPGIVLYEVTLYFAATFLNVRASVRIKVPEEQAMARLRLEFVQLADKIAGPKQPFLTFAPLVVGLAVIGVISTSVLRLDRIFLAVQFAGLEALPTVLADVLATPGFWLWAYLMFTIANTMFPSDFSAMRRLRPVVTLLALVIGVGFLLGVSDDLLGFALSGPLNTLVVSLIETLAIVAALDLFVTLLLSIVENTYERIRGDSATFQNGKLVALTKAQIQAAKTAEREKARKAAEKSKQLEKYTSIYDFPFPLPAAPGRETEVVITKEEPAALTPSAATSALTGREGASTITSRPLSVQDEQIGKLSEDEL